MQATFGIEREHSSELFYQELVNDSGPFHFHSPIELYFVDAGEIEVFVNTQHRVLKAGEMAVSLSYDAHHYRSVSASQSSLLVIPQPLCGDFLAAVQNKRAANPFLCDEEAVREIKACVRALAGSTNDIKRRGLLYVMLGTILEHITLEDAEIPKDNSLSSRLLTYLDRHHRDDLDLTSLSAAMGYSPSYLSRYFLRSFGIGIPQYVNTLRLRSALLLLQSGTRGTTDCALESGFPSVRTFYRVFRNEFGCSPKEYLTKTRETT